MANTSVTYAADGAQVNFTVPFPFISRNHVKVFLNDAEVLQPSIWYWVSDSQITFRNPPTLDTGVVIRRVTPGDTRLVDFQNGAVLTEADLDLSANQNFYLAQEAYENYAALVNNELVRIATVNGIVDADPDIMIASLVDTMLADAAANTLQAAVGDIELNGEVILDIQTKLDGSIEVIDLIGAFNATETAFLLDTTKVKLGTLDTDPTFATKITTLEAADTLNSSSITTINTVTIPGIQGDVTDLEARYGVTLNVNGYITGFAQNNDGSSGTFVVLADKFAVVTPSTEWAASTAYSLDDMIRPTTPTSPSRVFRCTTAGTSGGSEPTWNTTISGTTNDNTAVWTTYDDTSLYPFTVTGDETFMNNVIARTVRYGQTGYDSGTGYFLGDVSGTPKFSLGNSAGNKLTWDGTELAVSGEIDFQNATQTFTPTWEGFSTAPTGDINYLDLGKIVIMWTDAVRSGTSNQNYFRITNLPSAIRPGGARGISGGLYINNTFGRNGGAEIYYPSNATLHFKIDVVTGSNVVGTTNNWTASSTKGLAAGWLITYVK